MGERGMLLRRISAHMKQQNWFAVVDDFVIVVTGVVLGIQVANWNVEFQVRQDERQILQRLSDETDALLTALDTETAALERKVTLLKSAQPVIYSAEPARPLTEGECQAVTLSHIYVLGSDELTILNELIETGRFDRLRDTALKQKLREYILFRDRLRSRHEERTNEIFRLANRHPDLISVTAKPREEDYEGDWTWLSAQGYRWLPRCDIQRMRSNQAFLNDFFDNSGRTGSVVNSYRQREARLTSLKESLTAALEK